MSSSDEHPSAPYPISQEAVMIVLAGGALAELLEYQIKQTDMMLSMGYRPPQMLQGFEPSPAYVQFKSLYNQTLERLGAMGGSAEQANEQQANEQQANEQQANEQQTSQEGKTATGSDAEYQDSDG